MGRFAASDYFGAYGLGVDLDGTVAAVQQEHVYRGAHLALAVLRSLVVSVAARSRNGLPALVRVYGDVQLAVLVYAAPGAALLVEGPAGVQPGVEARHLHLPGAYVRPLVRQAAHAYAFLVPAAAAVLYPQQHGEVKRAVPVALLGRHGVLYGEVDVPFAPEKRGVVPYQGVAVLIVNRIAALVDVVYLVSVVRVADRYLELRIFQAFAVVVPLRTDDYGVFAQVVVCQIPGNLVSVSTFVASLELLREMYPDLVFFDDKPYEYLPSTRD